MKHALVAATILGAIAAPAASAQDWSGFYGGLALGRSEGEMNYTLNGAFNGGEPIDGTMIGAFAGYQVRRGTFVFGGELAYSTGDVEYEAGYGFTGFLDLKARLGYTVENVLIYGTAGWTTGDWKEEGFPALSSDGPAYGVGFDVMVSDRVFLGGEYLWRDVESEPFPAPVSGYEVEGAFGTLSLRIGMAF